MLHIVLFVLKLLGILLLAVMILLLLAVLAVLLVPVRYRARAKRDGTWRFSGRLWWLARIVGADISWEDGKLKASARLFWLLRIPLYPREEKAPPAPGRQRGRKKKGSPSKPPAQEGGKPAAKERAKPAGKPAPAARAEESGSLPLAQQGAKAVQKPAPAARAEDPGRPPLAQQGAKAIQKPAPAARAEESPQPAAKRAGEGPEREDGRQGAGQESESLWEKMVRLAGQLREKLAACAAFFRDMRYTFEKFCAKIADIRQNIQYYTEVLQEEETRQAFGLCREELLRLVRHVLPRKVRGNIRFGLEDPAATGQLFGLYCAFCQFPGWELAVEPDFEQPVLEGELEIKGKARGAAVLRAGWKLLRSRDIRHLIRRLRRE